MVDWICDYYQGIEDLPVRSELHVGDVRSLLPPEAPVGPESWTKISQDFQEKIMPGESPRLCSGSRPHGRRRRWPPSQAPSMEHLSCPSP